MPEERSERLRRPSFNLSDVVIFHVGKEKHVGKIRRIVSSKLPIYEIRGFNGLPWLMAEEKLKRVDV